MALPDVLVPGLRVVFCGTAAGARSAAVGAYYAGPGNQFWPTLHTVVFTPRRLAPRDFPSLPDYGLGLTDVCKVVSGSDREVGDDNWDVDGFIAKIELYRPDWVAFNGKKAAQVVLDRPFLDVGPQPDPISASRVFVLPSTSGAARRYWSADPWRELAAAVSS